MSVNGFGTLEISEFSAIDGASVEVERSDERLQIILVGFWGLFLFLNNQVNRLARELVP